MKIDGRNIIVFLYASGQWKTLAYGTTCQLEVQAETIGISSPDTGQWEQLKKKRFSWRVSSGHLLAAGKQETDILEIMKAGEPVKISFSTVEATEEQRDFLSLRPSGDWGFEGMAIVERVTITAKVGDVATLSMNFTGTGELNA